MLTRERKKAGQSLRKIWAVADEAVREVSSLMDLQSVLLNQRGLRQVEEAESFFEPRMENGFHDPNLFYGMEEAVDRIRRAVRQGERIIVYGDYDVDGVSGTAILMTALRQLGGQVSPYIPHRMSDGYGLSREALERLWQECDLLITVDCGVSNIEEIDWMRKKEKDVIVVDHHQLASDGRLPSAVAVIHPRHPAGEYPFGHLAAAGVAWKVAQALLGEERAWELLDLAVLGTVADMVPMLGENRSLGWFGLRALAQSRRPGLQALLAVARVGSGDLSVEHISWRMAPLLNAAGKMDHAQPALDLLMAGSPREAAVFMSQLEECNRQRRLLTTRMLREAEEQVDEELPVLFACHHDWPVGVVGLVAGRLAEKYGRPAVVVGGNGKEAVGSARAPKGMDVLSLLRAGEKIASRLGGHARAAGFSVAFGALEEFKEEVVKAARQVPVDTAPSQSADAIVGWRLISRDTWSLVEKFAPFGEGNARPKLIARDMELSDWRPVGSSKSHAKCVLSAGGEIYEAIGFGLADVFAGHKISSRVDVMFNLEMNVWRGRQRLQLNLIDAAPAGQVELVGV